VVGAWSIPTAHQFPESVTHKAADEPWSTPERLTETFEDGNSIAANGYSDGFEAAALLLEIENPGRMFSQSVPSDEVPRML
jgi:hypothetical protein